MGARDSPSFGALLRTFRIAAGLSQEALAERADLSVRGISDLERGARVTPRLATVRRLAEGLGLDESAQVSLLAAARPSTPLPRPVVDQPAPDVPNPPTSLIGREPEITRLTALLARADVRLVTLTGTGGVGKTRVALEVASRMAHRFGEGVCFVELAALTDPDLVASAIAHRLGVREVPGGTLVDEIIAHLRTRQLLLILDNFEHVLPAGVVVTRIIAACPEVRVLVTSRTPLRVRGEQEWMLYPLALPSPESEDSGTWFRADAVRLFVERATAVRPDIDMAAGEARAIAELCLRLDGLPLALELAAAQVKLFPPSALLERLEERLLPLLAYGASDLPERQRTMRSTITWSYELLDSPARTLFRRLSVFAGGWTLDAAEAVVNPDGDLDVVEAMLDLVNGSIVRQGLVTTSPVRFEMLETVREFGLEQLSLSDEHAAIRAAHVAWLLGLTDQAGQEIVGPRRAFWMSRLQQDVGNLRAALAWAWSCDDPDTMIRLAAPIWHFWSISGYTDEGRTWLGRALDAQDPSPSALRAEGLYSLGSLAATRADRAGAQANLGQALSIWRTLGNQTGAGLALQMLGTHALEFGENEQAADFLEQAIDAYNSSDEMRRSPWYALALSELGVAALRVGDRERAMHLAEQGLRLQRESGSPLGEALVLVSLGDIALGQQDLAEACRRYIDGLTLLHQIGEEWYIVLLLHGFISLLVETGLLATAARVLGAQDAALRVTGRSFSGRYEDVYRVVIARLQEALGEDGLAGIRAEGASIRLEDALMEAVGEVRAWLGERR